MLPMPPMLLLAFDHHYPYTQSEESPTSTLHRSTLLFVNQPRDIYLCHLFYTSHILI